MAELGSNQCSHSGSMGMSLEDGLGLLKSIWNPQVKKNFQGQHSYDQRILGTTPLEGRPVAEAEPHTAVSGSQWLHVSGGIQLS